MPAAPSVRRPWAALGSVAVTAITVLALAGCGAAQGPDPDPPVPTATASASPTGISTPPQARSLAEIGVGHGPNDRVFIPAGAVITTRIDQVNVVTLVFSDPTGAELARFYRDTLPAAGFTVTGEGGDSLTFVGFGWDGAFTASGPLAGLTLRRQA